MSLLRRHRLATVLFIGFGLRLLLANIGTYYKDLHTFIAWGHRLNEVGFRHFYEAWSDYLPGYLYVLWFLARVESFFTALVPTEIYYKLPAILTDLVSGLVIYKVVAAWRDQKTAVLILSGYLLNPAILANSTLWGQIDGINSLFYLLAILAAANDKVWLVLIWLPLALVIKPQGLVIAPLCLVPYFWRRQWWKLVLVPLFSSLTALLLFWPFLPSGRFLPGFAWERFQASLGQYQITSLNAFNLWAALGKLWENDQQLLGPLSFNVLGLGFFAIAYVLILLIVGRKLVKKMSVDKILISLASLMFLALFLLPTRVHERHLFSALPFLVMLVPLFPGFFLIYAYFSLSYLVNLNYAYIWLTQDFRTWLSLPLVGMISWANLLVGLGAVFELLKTTQDRILAKASFLKETLVIKKGEFNLRKTGVPGWLILVLVLFALMTRTFRLNFPDHFYFDEVYHAFTASEMVKGHNAAWEWWNTPPEGMAYEWTHPPLAKEFMASSIFLFGAKAWAWRLPGALLGSLSCLLILALGEQLFPKTPVGLVAAFLYSVDFLPLVQSRIGMNDTYFLFFQLLSFWAMLKAVIGVRSQKGWSKLTILWLLATALAWGAALASKWTALYAALPIGGFIILLGWQTWSQPQNFKWLKSLLAGLILLVLPMGVYLFSYLPFFTSGHTFSQLIDLQKQMWWYHTRLVATHPYTSSWWTWPLDLRPVWYFVNYQGMQIANIYAFGNPIIWWGGLIAMIWLSLKVFSYWRNHGLPASQTPSLQELTFLVIGYLTFFLPWAVSPRIMFIYHYLPSLPFLYLALAWFLVRLRQQRKETAWASTAFLLASLIIFVFFYPHLTALPIPKTVANFYFWLPSWR